MQVSEYDLIEMEKRTRSLRSALERDDYLDAVPVTDDVLRLVDEVRSLRKQLDAASLGWA